MRGAGGRSALVLLLLVALLTTALPSAALATGGCSSEENGTASAPPGQPALIVDVEWDARDDVMVEYWAVPSWGDGYPAPPAWTGGCTDDAWGPCNPLYPLILTDPGIFGYNAEDGPDSYTLMAMINGACVYAGADGQPDGDRVAGVYASISEVPVTATIDDVAADGSKRGSAQALSVVLPMPPDEAIADYKQWFARYSRALGTFDWDPATGLSNLQAAAPAHLDDVTPSARAESPSRSDARSPSSSAADPRSRLTRDESFVIGLFLLGVLADYGPGGLLDGLLTGQLASVDVQPDKTPGAPSFTRSKGPPVQGVGARPADEIAAAGDESSRDPASRGAEVIARLVTDAAGTAAATSPHPSKPPPKGKLKKKRVWVSLPAAAIVYAGKFTDERELKTGVWYQMKQTDDGVRMFCDKKGEYLGLSHRDEVWVRLWTPEKAGAGGS